MVQNGGLKYLLLQELLKMSLEMMWFLASPLQVTSVSGFQRDQNWNFVIDPEVTKGKLIRLHIHCMCTAYMSYMG